MLFRQKISKAEQGFTLVELLITVAMLAILLALATPSFQRFMANNRLKAATNELTASIYLARSEAIKRGTAVRLVRSPLSGAALSWQNGWLVILKNSAGNEYVAGSDEILGGKQEAIPATHATFVGNFTDVNGAIGLAFNSMGYLVGGGTSMQIQNAYTLNTFNVATSGRLQVVSTPR